MTEEILDITARWAQAIQSRSPENVIKLYHSDALLWGTLAKEPRHGHERIKGYFIKFLQREEMKCEFKETIVRDYNDIAICSGSYDFSWKVADKLVIVPARFSFVFKKEKDNWYILEHHSSLYPDQLFKMRNFIISDP
jgi:uncharacterized protein (TIGR02246 family)